MDTSTKQQFIQAYNTYVVMIRRHIYYKINNWELAEDLTQDTFLKSWDYIVEKGKTIREMKSFLYMVANNLVIDFYRQKDKLPLSIDEIQVKEIPIGPSIEYEIDHNIRMKIFKTFLSDLEENYRRVITYRYIEHKSIDEISELTGKSPNYVSVIIYQGIKILKENIKRSFPKPSIPV